jgi:putative acetyltransferase
MTTIDTESEPRDSPRELLAGVTIRAREPDDWRKIHALTQLPRVRWGTLRLPYASPEQTRKWMETPRDDQVGIVALRDGRIVGSADINRYKGRRSHAGGVGIIVHDASHGRGIGTALMAALVDTSDNWLDLKRLELTVFVDNEPAIRLYKKFGFVVEGTRRADAFRDGKYVDSYQMARVRGL